MKRLLLVMMCLFMVFNSFTFANYYEQEDIPLKDGISGEEGRYKIIGILSGGQDVFSEIPPILYVDKDGNSKSMVSVDFFKNYLGMDTYWDEATGKIVIKNETLTFEFNVESQIATVNGKNIVIPDNVPPKNMYLDGKSSPMLPIAFVARQLGYEVGWIQDTLTVTIERPLQSIKNIYFDKRDGKPQIRIKTTGRVDATSFAIKGQDIGSGNKIVVDILNSKFDLASDSLNYSGVFEMDVYRNSISVLRASQFDPVTLKSRVVVELQRQKGYELEFDEETNELVISFVNKVKRVEAEDILNSKAVVIKTKEQPAYNVTFLSGKVIVDVINSQLSTGEGVYSKEDVSDGGIESITTSALTGSEEYGPSELVSRVVVDLENDVDLEDVYIEDIDNDIYVYVAGNPLDGFEYVRKAGDSSSLDIDFVKSGSYSLDYDKNLNRILLRFDQSNTNLDEFNMNIEDPLVKEIFVEKKDITDQYIVGIDLFENVKYYEMTNESNTDNISLTFINEEIMNSKFKDYLIVVDPGHGGHDSGAVGKFSALKEKDLVLETSLRFKKELERSGFKVYITRDEDVFIGLYDRPKIANELNADLFVSIHFNAAENPKAKGVEVLYAPDAKRNNKAFARVMQDALLKNLKAVDRGIVARPNLVVLKYTKMDAVLAELGFLSHQEEGYLVGTNQYLNTCAKALKEGVINYIKQINRIN